MAKGWIKDNTIKGTQWKADIYYASRNYKGSSYKKVVYTPTKRNKKGKRHIEYK